MTSFGTLEFPEVTLIMYYLSTSFYEETYTGLSVVCIRVV